MDFQGGSKNNPSDSVLAFDTLYTTNEIQLLKIALPLLSADLQPLVAALIKARELSYCYQMITHTGLHRFSVETTHLDRFFKEAKSYCNEKQRRMFDMLENLQRTMQILEKMQLLSDDIPLDGNFDIATLMQLMPLMQQAGKTTEQGEAAGQENPSKENPLKETPSKENPQEENPQETAKNNAGKDEAGDSLSPLLKNALTDEQKQMYEKFKEKFSSM